MHAADVIETLPTALPDDDVLSAVQMVARHMTAGPARQVTVPGTRPTGRRDREGAV